jgi:predicted amidohydrolase YtcJ
MSSPDGGITIRTIVDEVIEAAPDGADRDERAAGARAAIAALERRGLIGVEGTGGEGSVGPEYAYDELQHTAGGDG